VKNMKKPALVWKWKEFFIASGWYGAWAEPGRGFTVIHHIVR
jgi:hypothetical protein